MAAWLSRIGRGSSRHPWRVIATWVLVLAGVVVAAGALGKPMTDTYSISGLSSISTLNKVNAEFGGSGTTGEIVFAAPEGQHLTARDAATIGHLTRTVAAFHGVTSAADPFTSSPKTISPDKRIGYISIGLTDQANVSTQVTSALTSAQASDPHLRIVASSELVPVPDGGNTEGISLLVGFVVLLITFGALYAAGLPLLTSVIGLGVSLESVHLATSLVSLNSIATVLATLLGLATGIDYSLFIVNRHRRQVKDGMDVRDSIALATGTAGSAVVFAAATVIIALAGLAVIRIQFLTQMGLAGAFAVLIAMLMSLTLTPALLRLIGPRVLSRRARRRMADPTRPTKAAPGRIAARWVSLTSGHPVAALVTAVVVLGAIAIPALSMRTSLTNDGQYAASTAARQAYDLRAEGFGKGINGPLEVLATYPPAATSADATALTERLKGTADVAEVFVTGVKGDNVLATVLPSSGPSDQATINLVKTLRSSATTADLPGTPQVETTGNTAVNIDISAKVMAAFPMYLGLIVGLAFLLLMVVFRSILVPLKATAGFVLSLLATLGGVTAMAQWGWGAGLLHLTPSPLLCFLPVIVTGVLFGLSMDYEMFLVSGMREHVAHGVAPRQALTRGFAAAAGVVIAAGAIMISVFGGGSFGSDPTTQVIAFALALGVILDVFIVRMVFVPAVLALLGRHAWWMPRWLDRILPNLDVEGTSLTRPSTERRNSVELTAVS